MICALLLTLVLLAPVTASGVSVDFFAFNGGSEAFLSEMAIHPTAIKVGKVTYIAYQGLGYDPYVASYNEATKKWSGPYRVGLNTLVRDGHGSPSLFTDPQGRLHVLYGSHNSPMYHARTVTAGDISKWESLGPVDDGKTTYPQAFKLDDGRLVLFYRKLSSSRDWVMRVADANYETFGPATVVLRGDADTWWYADFRPGKDGAIHAAFVWQDYAEYRAGITYSRHHVYYMRRNPESASENPGAWCNLEGEVQTIPLNKATADANVRVVDSGTDLCNEISVKEGPDGKPRIMFLRGSGAGPDRYTWNFLRAEEVTFTPSLPSTETPSLVTTFTPSVVAQTDHFFDSGAFRLGTTTGTVEAVVVNGQNGAAGGENGNPRGRGGRLDRFTSVDDGLTWVWSKQVSPSDEPLTDFADPQFVLGDTGSGPVRLAFIEWSADLSNFFNRIYLWGDSGLVTCDIPPTVARLEGRNRAATAVQVSRESFPEGSDAVVIATEDNFPDALAGVPFAHAIKAPLLLGSPDGLSNETIAEIIRLGAKKAYMLGGAHVLGVGVEKDLYGSAGITASERLYGTDRYRTAAAIARRMRLVDPTLVVNVAYVVSGENYPDATVAAPLAAIAGAPILLTKKDSFPSVYKDVLEDWGINETVVIGGSDVISDDVVDTLPSPERVWGQSRYETARTAAEYSFSHGLNPYRLVLATGENFPDALTGGGLAARMRAPVLLTKTDTLSSSVSTYFRRHDDTVVKAYIMGGDAAVSSGAENALDQLMD